MNGRSEPSSSPSGNSSLPGAAEACGPASAALAGVESGITLACLAAARPRPTVQLLAVSKTFPAPAVLDFARLGQRAFGENYLQEARDKQLACASLDATLAAQIEWHFIGPIQSNKTRPIAEHFAWVHSVDRDKIARRLIEQRPRQLPPVQLCLQVNISGEASKSGVAPEALGDLVIAVADMISAQRDGSGLGGARLRGVMCIPEAAGDEAAQRKPLADMRRLFGAARDRLRGHAPDQAADFDTLSMGMSADLKAAILEGATIVRVGSALFGARSAPA